MMSSNEIVTLINALGTGSKDFNIDNLRYEKIIIMTDADVDGSHIRTLLLTLFNNHPFNELIEKNHIYLAQPPLYKITKGSKNYYIKDDKELENFLIKLSGKNKNLIRKSSKEFAKFIEKEISKNKGIIWAGLLDLFADALKILPITSFGNYISKFETSKARVIMKSFLGATSSHISIWIKS